MIDRTTFNEVVKDCLANLYDFTALETHPLIFSILKPPVGYTGTREEFVRSMMLEAIDMLRPQRNESNPSSMEWRPYLILHKRFVEGMGLQELADFLAISGRQLRRDQARSLQAVAAVLWEKLYQEKRTSAIEKEPGLKSQTEADDASGQSGSEDRAFELHDEVVDLPETIRRVFDLLHPRLVDKGAAVEFEFAQPGVPVIADRVVLRQILISMFNAALHIQAGKEIEVKTRVEDGQVAIRLAVQVSKEWEAGSEEEEDSALDSVSYWCSQIRASLNEAVEVKDGKSWLVREILLPRSDQRVVMVVDDQEPAINLFRRYLSQSNIITIGASQPDQVIPLANHFQPILITLDVMMPKMDGWELLQQLKTNNETRHIPVIVCSAWEDPDLSRSLGADKFLKKPVTQKMLLAAMEELAPNHAPSSD